MEAQTTSPEKAFDAYIQLRSGVYLLKSSPALAVLVQKYYENKRRQRKTRKPSTFVVRGFSEN